MKRYFLLFILTLISYTNLLYGKEIEKALDFGGGPYKSHSDDSRITEAMRVEILTSIKKNIEELKAQGILPSRQVRSDEPMIVFWPLTSTTSDYGYYRMGHFPDHDGDTNSLLDYMGGDRTYDRESDGYDHKGTDIIAWPFSWHKMDNDEVQVVAAAAGTIVKKVDGNYDRECFTLEEGNFNFNSIYILHDNGSIAWYVHLKKGSLTPKNVGESVEVGEYLGIIGSSGWSWEPHLHFELIDSTDKMVDPNIGPYNPSPSINWAEGVQRPYYDSAINKVMTHSAPPDFTVPCPEPATINGKDDFPPGDTLYVAAYYRDQLSTQVSQYTIYRPDNSVFQSWEHSSGVDPPHPSTWQPEWALASHWYWGWTLPQDAPEGTWKFEVVYEGNTYEHIFTVSIPPNNAPSFAYESRTCLNGMENLTYSGSIAKDAFDPDDDPVTFSKISGPAWLNVSSTGELSGIPGEGDAGENSFVVGVEDDREGSDEATLNIFIFPFDENPVVLNPMADLILLEDFDSLEVANLNTVFCDGNLDPLTCTVVSQGKVNTSIAGENILMLNSVLNANGVDTLVVTAYDDLSRAMVSDTFLVTLTPVNDPPYIEILPDTIEINNITDTTVILNVFVDDVDSPQENIIWEYEVSNPSLQYYFDPITFSLNLSAPGFVGVVEISIIVTDDGGASGGDSIVVIVTDNTTGIFYSQQGIPERYILEQNYPNPFNPTTHIRFGLPLGGDVNIDIYNVVGQHIATVMNEFKTAGYHEVEFDASQMSSGMYLIRFEAADFIQVRKMIILQ
jgi:murein DD-endopeptidase MepM/ murein hydrolase activator NlpD